MNDINEYKEAHNIILDYIKSKNIDSVMDYLDLPNKYGDNCSTYYAKYNVKDRWNYTEQEVSIDYTGSYVFLPNLGYFPFKTIDDIKNIINQNTNLR